MSPLDSPARAVVNTMPLDTIDVSDPQLYQDDACIPTSPGCGARTRYTTAMRAATAPIGQ
jgi:hypothetical protein